jgi:hypothetical protein
MLEAMAVGLPIVATRVGAAAEVAGDPAIGILVRPGDAGALRDALAAALFDPACADLGRRARARAVEAFGLPATADRLARLYEEVRNSPTLASDSCPSAHRVTPPSPIAGRSDFTLRRMRMCDPRAGAEWDPGGRHGE